ncbi:MAG: hypothetical protein HWN66_02700 [Candidatus Helarchaeota archaeon]|nr:hypothetical protein [Candidatus Helarchaeota archaeon]
MSKKPHVSSSIFLITIMILPAIFILGVILPIMINNILNFFFGDCSIFFTIFGIIFLVSFLIPPPPGKKRRTIFFESMKRFFKKFLKPKLTDEIVFKDDIVHFAATEHLTENSSSKFEYVNDELKSYNNSTIAHSSQDSENRGSISNVLSQPKKHKTTSKHRINFYHSFSDLDLTNSLNESNFELISNLFLKKYSQSTAAEYALLGGDKRNVQFTTEFSINPSNYNNGSEWYE